MADKPFSRFTEQDSADLEKIPRSEVSVFHTRLADITMRTQVAEDTYTATMDSIRKDAELLFDTIKERLKVFREYGR